MVKRLGDLTVEEREIEDLMKSYSLGDWGLGKTRAVYEYDENQYDEKTKNGRRCFIRNESRRFR